MRRTLTVLFLSALVAMADGVRDSPGVSVSLNGSILLHRSGVVYPAEARNKGIQGTVTLEVSLDERGNVSDARVISGPAELRRASLQSVLDWHFAPEGASSTQQISIQFVPGVVPGGQNARALVRDFNPAVVVLQQSPAGPLGLPVKSIQISGLPQQATEELLARLPAHPGDTLSLDLAEAVSRAVRDFDEHLRLGFTGAASDGVVISILLSESGRELR
jgi:TonB family protein